MNHQVSSVGRVGVVLAVSALGLANTTYAAGKSAVVEQPGRDPFTTSELMIAESGRLSSGGIPGGRGFIPNMGVGQVPKMELKGFVDGKNPMAMLEIEGIKRVFPVRKGDELDLRIYKIPIVIQILEVNGLSVKIRTGTINQVLVVR